MPCRYYAKADLETGVTREQLAALGPDQQRLYLIDWFERTFEDPVHDTPYNGQDGGYQFISGGPYDAATELQREFAGLVSEELIAEMAEYVEGIDGVTEWAPGPEHADASSYQTDDTSRASYPLTERRGYLLREDGGRIVLEDAPPPVLPPGQDYITDEDGTYLTDEDGVYLTTEEPPLPEPDLTRFRPPVEALAPLEAGNPAELAARRMLIDRVAELERELGELRPRHGRPGHNNPPSDCQLEPETVAAVDAVAEAVESMAVSLAADPPTVAVIVRDATFLQRFWHWSAGKLDTMADEFAKGFGKTLGTSIAIALAGGALLPLVLAVVHSAIVWLHALGWAVA